MATCRSSGPRRASERGETLIELLLTIALMGIAMVAIIGGVFELTRSADRTHHVTQAGNGAQSYAEQIKQPVDDSASIVGDTVADMAYRDCATASGGVNPYPDFVGPLPEADYTAEVVDIEYLQSLSTAAGGVPGAPVWGSSCPSPDLGLQRITVEVSAGSQRQGDVETVTIVKRDAKCDYSTGYENADQGPC